MPDINSAIKWLALVIVGAVVLMAIGVSAFDVLNNIAIPGLVYAIDSYALLQSIALLGFHGATITNGNGNGAAKNGNGSNGNSAALGSGTPGSTGGA